MRKTLPVCYRPPLCDQLCEGMDYKLEYRGEEVEVSEHSTQMDEIMQAVVILKHLLGELNDRMANLEEILLSGQQEVRPPRPSDDERVRPPRPPRPSDDDDGHNGQPPAKKPVKSRLGVKGRLG